MNSQRPDYKLAVIGGGSGFVLCVLQGIAEYAERWRGAGVNILVSLFDIRPEAAQRWVAYGEVVGRKLGIPMTVECSDSREQALTDADVVMFSVGFREAAELAEQMRQRFGFDLHSIHDGPPAFAFSAKVWPFCAELAEEIARLAPSSLTLVLPNPTDVLAEAMSRYSGIDAAGFCVEVEHLRDHLAFYFGYSTDEIVLHHAGVNHDGWVLQFNIRGEDGYALLHERILALPEHPHFHPGNFGMVSIYRATGYLRSSAYHNWPMQTPRYEGPRTWEEFAVSAEDGKAVLERAVAAGELLNIPADLHPERRVVKYLGTGRAVSRLMLARATGSPEVVPLQVPNAGAVANFPADVRVEVPAVVLKSMVIPMAVGEVPEWLGGTTRLLALQRKLHAEYLISGSKDSLVQALLTLPTVAPVNVLMEYADVVHSLRR